MRKLFSFTVNTKSRRLDCFIRPKDDFYEVTFYDEDYIDFGHSFVIRKFSLRSLEDVHLFINNYKSFYGSSCTVF